MVYSSYKLTIGLLLLTLCGCLQADERSQLVHVGGALRQSITSPAKWCWINDANHTPTGFNPKLCGTAKGATITFNYGVKYSKVINLIAQADNDYTYHLDMQIGTSVGLDKTILVITSFGQPINVDTYLGYSHGNIWVSGMMER